MTDIAALASWSAWWEVVDVVGVGIVLAGVIGEGISEWPPRKLKDWPHLKNFGRISWLVLVAGLAVELVAQHKKDANDALIIAFLTDQTEHEKTARAKFEAQFSWRVIDEGQTKSLISALSGSPHVVAIEFPGGDLEAQFFGIQLMKIFQDAGWKVDIRSNPAPPLLFGVDVPGPTNEATNLVRHALTAASINVGEKDFPSPGLMMQTDEGRRLTPDCRILVGAKLTDVIRDQFSVK